MHNPWTGHNFQLTGEPDPCYILPEDCAPVRAFNKIAHPDHFIHPYLLPEPYLGDPAAPIVLLNGNPGYSDSDKEAYRKETLFRLSVDNLLHTPSDYPFHLLNPAIRKFGGYMWWSLKLKPLLNLFDPELLACKLLVVEYFPYHSKRAYNFHKRPSVSSQQYSFYLVEQALQRNALVIINRWAAPWYATIPDLKTYTNIYRLNSPMNAVISPRNCPGGFEKIVEILKAA